MVHPIARVGEAVVSASNLRLRKTCAGWKLSLLCSTGASMTQTRVLWLHHCGVGPIPPVVSVLHSVPWAIGAPYVDVLGATNGENVRSDVHYGVVSVAVSGHPSGLDTTTGVSKMDEVTFRSIECNIASNGSIEMRVWHSLHPIPGETTEASILTDPYSIQRRLPQYKLLRVAIAIQVGECKSLADLSIR
jgi:hypothetical protein